MAPLSSGLETGLAPFAPRCTRNHHHHTHPFYHCLLMGGSVLSCPSAPSTSHRTQGGRDWGLGGSPSKHHVSPDLRPCPHPSLSGYTGLEAGSACHCLILLLINLSSPASLVQRDCPAQALPWQLEAARQPSTRLPRDGGRQPGCARLAQRSAALPWRARSHIPPRGALSQPGPTWTHLPKSPLIPRAVGH